jgi:hypothetical protein
VIVFLQKSKAVIVDLEDFTEDEVLRLRSEEGRGGRSLFVAAECHDRWDGNFRRQCSVVCPLKESE